MVEVKRGEDEDYHQICSTFTRLKLPRPKANELYEMKQALLDARAAAGNDPNSTPEQRQAVLQRINEETQRTARQLLGEKAFNSLARSGQVEWLRNQ